MGDWHTEQATIKADNSLLLPDGRRLGYAQYGDAHGAAKVFYFHGLPFSRLEAASWAVAAKKLGIHFIGIDQQGIGLSTPKPTRRLIDSAGDVKALAEALGFTRYHVLGFSGGGPLALACAHALPGEALAGAGVVAGVASWSMGYRGMALPQRIGLNIMAWIPRLGLAALDMDIVPAAQNLNKQLFASTITSSIHTLPIADQAVLLNPTQKDIFIESMREAYLQGSSGVMDHIRVLTSNWGFRLQDIARKNIHLWYGSEDTICPVSSGRRMAALLPHSKFHAIPGGTHFTTPLLHQEEILRELTQPTPALPRGSLRSVR